ncbi:hypothetical protein KFL_000520420 [Klebsormidium nitens]|uniref:YLP motif-containing protein 1 n=1 Tax=Klebsormidium nitens TaxID=105231 RepID=A0A1Y1HT48_KLENI|nr:hypothetical protein KFL_000520420 [Klebsormidium nitens]|eukprot:GAQ80369.1 hypothetical protein KFL_000520420 [Klebsormidium nitens]
MASHPLVTPEQVASAGRAAGVCYYCGAPLGAAHHSYCTLVKALPQAPYSAPTVPPPHHQYDSQASTPGYEQYNQLPASGHTFFQSAAPAAGSAVDHAQWQPYDSQWFDAGATPPDQDWHEVAPPSPPPPPPGPEEGPPPLPPEDGHAPLPPAEQPPPPPEEPAEGSWEAGHSWNGAQSGQIEPPWGLQAGSSGMQVMSLWTHEQGPAPPDQQDALSGRVRWVDGPHPHGGNPQWEGLAWGHAGGAAAAASSSPPDHEQPPDHLSSGQNQPLSAPQGSFHPSSSAGPLEGQVFAPPPWQRPAAQPDGAGLASGAASTADVQPAGGAGRGSGMESIRDYYAAPGQPQIGAHMLLSMLQGGPYLGAPDPRPMMAPAMPLPFPLHHTPPLVSVPEQPRRVDARDIFKQPGRSTRPDRFVVILRGLPGSGKSHLARALRDVEVMNGGSAPRVHTMDDYFVTEVEKEVEVEDGRGRKRKSAHTAMEYVYEPELEQAYAASMLKAFRKTLEEGRFHFVIVDYWNLVVSEFEPYWKAAKSSGFEVYVLQPAKLDPEACARRNIHGFTLEAVTDMARRWEPLPPQYLQLDVQSLFRGDLLDTGDIAEVDMDADPDPAPPAAPAAAAAGKRPLYESDEEDADTPHHAPPSRPSARPDKGAFRERDTKWRATDSPSRRQPPQPGATSGTASKGGPRKEVKWADLEGEKEAAKGFRIGVDLSKKRKLEIGPGAGYTQDQTGPLQHSSAHEHAAWARKVKAQVRDEAEAFKAVVARRRQRIGVEEDDD